MSSGPLPDAATRLRREREAAIEENFERRQQQLSRMERLRTQRLGQLYERGGDGSGVDDEFGLSGYELEMLRRLVRPGRRSDDGVGTMGIGWSGDGRNLYVGTEEGILEYAVNIQERKTFPGIALQ